jgi:preprotein translocase subunit YajC
MAFAIAWFVLLAAVFFWFIVRPQRRRVAAHRAFVDALDVGDEVVTSGGLYGTVRALDEVSVELEVAPSVVIKVARGAIVQRARAIPAAGEAGDD